MNGNVREYVDAIAADRQLSPLRRRILVGWTRRADPYTRTETWAVLASGFGMATNVENAPTSEDLIGRGWIANVP